jgi:hypothetical protein
MKPVRVSRELIARNDIFCEFLSKHNPLLESLAFKREHSLIGRSE